jgi:hypothetical protein
MKKICEHIISWSQDNKILKGINWVSEMEIGLRIISWSLAYLLIADSKYLMEEALEPFLRSLYEHVNYLKDNLTTWWKVRNNHVIAEAAALVVFGVIFPEFRISNELKKTGMEVLGKELDKQIYDDGVIKEQSTSYHRYDIDLLLLTIILLRNNDLDISSGIEKNLENMLDFLMHFITPSGIAPMIGDSDHGRGFIYDESKAFWDFRASLSVGAVLFDRADFKFAAGDFHEEAFWLLGESGFERFNQIESQKPLEWNVYPSGGYYISRSGWSRDSDYILLRAGEFGLGGAGYCAHSHCDQLNIILVKKGIPILIDSGTYTYNTYEDNWREYFRSTSSHNVVKIDHVEQAQPLASFGWKNAPSAEIMYSDRNVVEAGINIEESSYKNWIRRIEYRKGEYLIRDSFKFEGEKHSLEWFFQLNPELGMDLTKDKLILQKQGKNIAEIEFNNLWKDISIKEGYVSYVYGNKQKSKRLVCCWEGIVDKEIQFDYIIR